jgi:hypothetical protein
VVFSGYKIHIYLKSEHKTYNISSEDTPVSCTNKTDYHDIIEISFKEALNTIIPIGIRYWAETLFSFDTR